MPDLILPPSMVARMRRKSTDGITDRDDVDTIMRLHTLCQKYNIGLFCPNCGTVFSGSNAPTDKEFVIECGCRELRFNNPKAIIS